VPNQVSRTLKLINEIGIYCCRSDLRSTPEYMWAWLSSWLVAMVDRIPSARVRRAITPLITVGIIVVIIVAGAAVIYVLVVTSKSPYP